LVLSKNSKNVGGVHPCEGGRGEKPPPKAWGAPVFSPQKQDTRQSSLRGGADGKNTGVYNQIPKL